MTDYASPLGSPVQYLASHSVDTERCNPFFFLPGYACQAVKQGGCSPWAWGVTVLGGQLAHLTTGRTWLFCFVWGGGRPQLMGGGV